MSRYYRERMEQAFADLGMLAQAFDDVCHATPARELDIIVVFADLRNQYRIWDDAVREWRAAGQP